MRPRLERPEPVHLDDGYRVVYEAHYARLVRLAVLLGVPRGHVEDVIADAFVRTLPHWRAGQITNIGGYLTTVTVNASRRNAHDREREPVPLPDYLPDDRTGPIDGLDRDEILRGLSRVPQPQREVLVLRYFNDLTEAATAEVLGVRIGTVKSRQARGLVALRTIMKGVFDA